jgi:hypothetical protein
MFNKKCLKKILVLEPHYRTEGESIFRMYAVNIGNGAIALLV